MQNLQETSARLNCKVYYTQYLALSPRDKLPVPLFVGELAFWKSFLGPNVATWFLSSFKLSYFILLPKQIIPRTIHILKKKRSQNLTQFVNSNKNWKHLSRTSWLAPIRSLRGKLFPFSKKSNQQDPRSPSQKPEYSNSWVFPKIMVPQNGWFIMEKTPLKWMIWGYPYFWKHPFRYGAVCCNNRVKTSFTTR